MNKLHKLSLNEIENLLKEEKITSTEVTKYFLNRINTLDEKIGSFNSVSSDNALKVAKLCDENMKNTNMYGIPIALKDNIVSYGEPSQSASKILEGFIGSYDATVVKKLKEAGVPIIGKCNMDEFAMGSSNEKSSIKVVNNPWDLERVPGGSSGGSAAAVASGLVPVALGTDTGGSVRQPAAFTGTVGLKPTYGRVSRYGLMAFASSLDQIGIIAKCSEDVAKTLHIIAGYDENDATSANEIVPNYEKLLSNDIKGLKIGIDRKYFENLNEDIKKVIEKALDDLKELGAILVDIDLKYTKYAISTYYIISSAEAASNLSRYDGVRYGYRSESDNVEDMYFNTRTKGFGKEVKRRIMLGNYVLSSGFYDAYYKKASKVRRLIKEEYLKTFETVDVIITPTTPTIAFKKGEKSNNPMEMYLSDIYTVPVSLAGIPAISVPVGFVNKMPVGMQIIGNYFKEDLLLNVSHQYEIKRGKIDYETI